MSADRGGHKRALADSRQRMMPFAGLLTLLLLISTCMELLFEFKLFASLQAVGCYFTDYAVAFAQEGDLSACSGCRVYGVCCQYVHV